MSMSIVDVDSKIVEIREIKVLLDCDVAALYGVETKRINEAVNNNPDKFPDGYVIFLKDTEIRELRSKISTAISNMSRVPPKAFTEKGLYMLATILKSPQATETTLAIIETFAKFRELTRNVREIVKLTDEEAKKPLMQRSGEIITDILGHALDVSETESTLKINLAVLNFEHTVRKKPKNNDIDTALKEIERLKKLLEERKDNDV